MLIFALILFVITVTYAIGAQSAAPWVPMRANDTARVLKILKQFPEVKKIVELGAGDGRLLAVTSQSGYVSEGYEISLLPYVIAQVRKLVRNLSYKIYYRSFWGADLSSANAVYFFLMPQILEKTKTKLLAELKPGSLILTYTWGLPGLTPLLIDQAPERPKIFVYKIGYEGK
ncbi:MAG: hypothetical protein KAZ30_01215 [Candidatus Magasanikbacteria bacterium]|nr:hypothetical protein [Candidatus Magasanikbacteria bacterium]